MGLRRKYRTAIFYKDYFEKFFIEQSEKVKAKIIWTIELIEELERVPEAFLKHIESTDGLYEIRVKLGSDIFRIFLFFRPWQSDSFSKRISKENAKDAKERN